MDTMPVELPAYAETVGIRFETWQGQSPVLAVDYTNDVCGNPGTFHGGAIGGLLQLAGIAAMRAVLQKKGQMSSITPVNATVEYLRGAGERTLYASGSIVRAGRRLANVHVTAWQESPDKPVATSVMNLQLD